MTKTPWKEGFLVGGLLTVCDGPCLQKAGTVLAPFHIRQEAEIIHMHMGKSKLPRFSVCLALSTVAAS